MNPEPDATVAEANVVSTDTSEPYKNLQRQIQKIREENKRLQREALRGDTLEAELTLNRAQIGELIDAIKEGTDMDEMKGKMEATNKVFAKVVESRNAIQELVSEADTDWKTDEKLEAARKAWDEKNFEVAVKETQKALGVSTNIQDVVDKRVEEKLRALGVAVDTGSQTAAGSQKKITRKAMSEAITPGMDVRSLRSAADEVLDRFFIRR